MGRRQFGNFQGGDLANVVSLVLLTHRVNDEVGSDVVEFKLDPGFLVVDGLVDNSVDDSFGVGFEYSSASDGVETSWVER